MAADSFQQKKIGPAMSSAGGKSGITLRVVLYSEKGELLGAPEGERKRQLLFRGVIIQQGKMVKKSNG